MKKKILFVIDSLNCGGAEKSLISLLNLINYEEYDVDLQLYSPNGMFKNLVPNEVNILPNLQYYDFINLPFRRQICTFRFDRIVSKIKFSFNIRNNKENSHGAQLFWKNCRNVIDDLEKEYDVAIAYNQGFSTYFVAEKVRANKKLAWVNVNYVDAGYNPKIDIKFYNKFNNIVAVSKGVYEILIDCFPQYRKKINIIYDINNAKLIEKMAKSKNVYEDIDKCIVKIVTVGRLVYQKGYEFALEACNILSEKNIDFKWYALGEGNERSNIEKYVSENNLEDKFILIGAVENPYPYIKDADVYVQTSRFEGFGLAIAEARILNTPVVTTNFDVVYNQMIHGKNGLIVNMDGGDIAQGIMKIIHDEELRNSIIEYLHNEKKGNIEEINKFYKIIK